ncbi:MAG: hypothetical protein R3E48_12620 [Burkholderiaceae bacterium]
MNDSTSVRGARGPYDRLAEAIDAVDPGRRRPLTKLALCLAHELGDRERIWRDRRGGTGLVGQAVHRQPAPRSHGRRRADRAS